jgi:alpha-L-fucosidase
VFTGNYFDGFANWNSTYSPDWNSVAVGAKRDVIAEIKQVFNSRHADIRFGLYYALYEWFNPSFLKDKSAGFATRYVFS